MTIGHGDCLEAMLDAMMSGHEKQGRKTRTSLSTRKQKKKKKKKILAQIALNF